MSVRRTASKKLLAAESLGASFVTDATDIKFMDNIGYIIECTSITSNTGIFTAQVQIEDSSWVDLEFAVPAQLAGSDTTFVLNLNQLPYEKIRVSFADSAGDGVCDVYVCGKGLGG